MIQIFAKLYPTHAIRRSQPVSERSRQTEQRAAPRTLALFWSATVTAADRQVPAIVVDLSATGARLRSALNPASGTFVVVKIDGIEALHGAVRWSDDGRFGMQFDRTINVVDVLRRHRAATGRHLGADVLV
jgi:hypothetical protein